jgi:hypothetical protein
MDYRLFITPIDSGICNCIIDIMAFSIFSQEAAERKARRIFRSFLR